MRRFLSFILLVPYTILHVFAYDVEVNGICYDFIARRAYVTHRGQWTLDVSQPSLTGPESSYTGDIVIPEQITFNGRTYTVTSIGENAFAGCEGLTSVQLPPTVRAVSSCAFLGCTNLRQVSLPTGLQAIASCAFVGCASLEQITLPRHAELVDSLSFYCCTSLSSVVLPHCVRTVCQGALEHLPSLAHLYSFADMPPVAELGAFTLADQQHCTLHVPAEAVALYQQSPIWSDFCEIVALSDEDYTSQNYRRGDINDDGLVNADDLLLLRRLIVSIPTYTALRWAADVNGDGIVNAIDYVTLSKQYLGL